MNALIKVERLGKTFVRRTASLRWSDVLAGRWKRPPRETLWALRDVSFEVAAGEMLGIVGANGAGKSTMLRMLGGVGTPTCGTVAIRGRIGALLELGGGFQADLTGRENVILAAVVAGLLKSEALERLPEIVRFAELEDFIDAPVRTYSTGMTMRLAFAVAVHTDPEVMLVDEFLSVGDLAFQAKCLARITAMRESGCAIVLVSHGMDQVRKLCDRALWLRRGQVVAFDAAEVVAAAYEREMREETLRRTPAAAADEAATGEEKLPDGRCRIGSREVEIAGVLLRPGPAITTGGPLAVEIDYQAANPVVSPVFVVSITKPDGTLCVDQSTQVARVVVPDLVGTGQIRLVLDRLDLAPGSYFVDVGVFESKWNHAYDFHYHTYPFTVEGGSAQKGVMVPPCHWSFASATGPSAKPDAAASRPRAAQSVPSIRPPAPVV